MTNFGTRTRAVAAALIFVLSPILSHRASSFAASYPLTSLAAFICLGVAYPKVLEGTDKKKGTNLALVTVPVLAWCFFEAITAELPLPNIPLAQNATELELELLPLPLPPAVPPGSTCRWHQDSNVWPLDLSSSNSSSPPPSLLPSSTLRSSVCNTDMDETRWNKMVSTVGNFDMIAVAAGIGPSEWDGPACKAAVIDTARRATTPYCSSSCSPLGFCDSDCRDVATLCGRMVSYDVLQGVMPNGAYEMIMKGMIGDLVPCLNDILVYITGNGDASKICDSSFYPFSHMSFGSTPNTDCLPLSTDPNPFLRDPSSSGSCALSNWDIFAAELDDVTAHNEALLLNATNATAADETAEEEPPPRFPSWREPAVALIPPAMLLLLLVGDRLSVKKKKSDSDNLATVTPVLDGDPPAPTPSSMADSLTFWSVLGLSGSFAATALLGIGALAMFLGFQVESRTDDLDYREPQAVGFYLIGLKAILDWLSTVVYWRPMVNKLVDVKKGAANPNTNLDKIPVACIAALAKRLRKFNHENISVAAGGKYSIVKIIASEVFEFMVQTSNANSLAKFLDWRIMRLYSNVIFANCLVFGFCLLAPDRYIPAATLISIDVLIDATYIIINIFFVAQPTSYWAILVPLALATGLLKDAFTRTALDNVTFVVLKEAADQKFDEAKASGTLPEKLCTDFLTRLNSGKRGRIEVNPPAGYPMMKPRMWYEDSEDSNVATGVLEFVLPGVTPGQAYTFSNRYTPEEKGLGTDKTVQVDLRDNEIVELPYELMDVESKNTMLLFDGNPCAEEVDWTGLGVDRLPTRMRGEGYDNGGWNSSLRVLKLGRNELDKSTFGELAANFANIEELDVSWNALGGVEEDVRGLKKLRKLDVSGNEGISAEDLVAAPEGLEMLNASFCGVNEIMGGQAVELQDRSMTLHGNRVTSITWPYELELKKIPAWLRTLEKITEANLEYCDVKEMQGGAFPASLEELVIRNQGSGLRLHPDSFEGLPKLRVLDASTNKITEDDMHPGLFAGATSLRELHLEGNTEMRRFNATELFPGGSKSVSLIDLR
ncbi:hypothetical protein TeGR_g13262, partial [Tetraparma gracilis]